MSGWLFVLGLAGLAGLADGGLAFLKYVAGKAVLWFMSRLATIVPGVGSFHPGITSMLQSFAATPVGAKIAGMIVAILGTCKAFFAKLMVVNALFFSG